MLREEYGDESPPTSSVPLRGTDHRRGECMSELLTEVVLQVVEGLPRGRVTSYGELAAVLSELDLPAGPRQVGRVLSQEGAAVPWWRMTRADGRLPEVLLEEARAHWLEEGTPLRSDGSGVQISRCRVPTSTLHTLAHTAQTRTR